MNSSTASPASIAWPSLLTATYFPQSGTLNTLVTEGFRSSMIHKLADDPARRLTIVCHSGCPDGSWSGEVVAKSLPQRSVSQLLQSYPMKSAEVEMKLLEQHGALGENATIMTADIMFDMATVLAVLTKNANVNLILTDHHGGTGKKFLEAYNALEPVPRKLVDDAINCGRLVVNVDTAESGASHIFNLLNFGKSTEQLKAMFNCQSDNALACYLQFMKSYDLTTMQPDAVRELTKFAADQIELDDENQDILAQCQAKIADEFIKENLLHFLLCYLTDATFNGKFHFVPPDNYVPSDSDSDEVAAPSFYDLNDPSYPGGKDDPNHKVLMKAPEQTKKFVTKVFEYCKDFNQALKLVNTEAFVFNIKSLKKVLSQGKQVTYGEETFFAANTLTRFGRFVPALVSSELKNYPDCKYAVLFGSRHNVSLTRRDPKVDLTVVVERWKEKELTYSGGGHPEAVGMQMEASQYVGLLKECQSAGIELDESQQQLILKHT